jgi:hypothetical protein
MVAASSEGIKYMEALKLWKQFKSSFSSAEMNECILHVT